ncbi:MAG: TolC family protein [Bdellovibrionota bacterium]
MKSLKSIVVLSTFLGLQLLPSKVNAEENAGLSLSECIRSAIENSLELKQKKAVVENARLQKSSVLSSYLPRVDSSFERTKNTSLLKDEPQNVYSSTENSLNLTLSETIDLQGKVYRAYNRSSLIWQKEKDEYDYMLSETINQVIDIYYTFQEAQASLIELTAKKTRSEQNYDLIKTEVSIGRRSPSDLGQIEHALAKINIEILNAESTIKSSLRKLGILLYSDNRRIPDILTNEKDVPVYADNWQNTVIKIDKAAIDEALSNRSDITALNHSITADQSLRKESLWKFAPDLNIKLNYMKNYSNSYLSTSEPDNLLSASLVMTWNIFSGGKDYFERQSDIQKQFAAEYGYKNKLEQEWNKLADAKEMLIAQGKLITASQDLLKSASLKFASIKAQYELGKKSTTDLLTAEEDYTNAEISLKKERFVLYKMLANFFHLYGKLTFYFVKN